MRRLRFSERIGIVTATATLQTNEISIPLRNSFWNLILDTCLTGQVASDRQKIKAIWRDIFRLPMDDLDPVYWGKSCKTMLSELFFTSQWYIVLDLIEYIAFEFVHLRNDTKHARDWFEQQANLILEEQFSGYRFIGDVLAPISNEDEVRSIEESICATKQGLYGTGSHMRNALTLLAQRPNPDLPNSIKESISAIESLSKQLTRGKGGGLGQALGILDGTVHFHPQFREGLLNLYNYTSDEDGIRHAILKESNVGFPEAKFMLVACSALVNFMIAKADESGLLRGNSKSGEPPNSA